MPTPNIRRLVAATILSVGLLGFAGSPAGAGHPGVDGPDSFTDLPRPECPPERESEPEPEPEPHEEIAVAGVVELDEPPADPGPGPAGEGELRSRPARERCPDPDPEPVPERNPDVVVARPNFTG